jgi:hypothetical protein
MDVAEGISAPMRDSASLAIQTLDLGEHPEDLEEWQIKKGSEIGMKFYPECPTPMIEIAIITFLKWVKDENQTVLAAEIEIEFDGRI